MTMRRSARPRPLPARAAHVVDVRARREAAARARENHRAHGIVRIRPVHGIYDFFQHHLGKGVQLIGPVQGNDADPSTRFG